MELTNGHPDIWMLHLDVAEMRYTWLIHNAYSGANRDASASAILKWRKNMNDVMIGGDCYQLSETQWRIILYSINYIHVLDHTGFVTHVFEVPNITKAQVYKEFIYVQHNDNTLSRFII